LGEVVVEVWDFQKKNKSVFLGEIRLPVLSFSSIHFDYAEQHTYHLQSRGSAGKKDDNIGGDIDLKIGMKLPVQLRENKKIKRNRIGVNKRSNSNKEETTFEEIMEEVDEVVEGSFASSKRSVENGYRIMNIIKDTNEKFDEQVEATDRILRDVAEIEILQQEERKHIRVIENPLGPIANKFHRNKKITNIEKEKTHLKRVQIKNDKVNEKIKKKKEIQQQKANAVPKPKKKKIIKKKETKR